MSTTEQQPAAKEVAAKPAKKELTATVAPFDIKTVKLKAQPHADHIHKSLASVIVYDAKLGLKEAEVWANKITGILHVADLAGNALENVTHILTIPKK